MPGEHAVRRAATRRPTTRHAPAVELFVERARAVAPGFEPDAERAGGDRRDRPPPRRAAAGDRAGGRPAAHPRRRRGRGRARPTASACCRPGTAHRHATVVGGGGRVVVRPARRAACSEVFADLSVFAGSFTRGRRRGGLRHRPRRRHRSPSHQLAERSLVMRAPGRRYVLLETLRAFGAEQLVADRPGRRGRASATPATRSTWVERADRGCRATRRQRPSIAEIDAAHPRAARRARLAARPRRGRARRPAGRRAARLRLPAAATGRPGVVGAGHRRRPGRPQPVAPRGLGGRAPTPRGWPVTCRDRRAQRPRPCGVAERAGGDVPPMVPTSLRQLRAVRRRLGGGRHAGTGGPSTRPADDPAQRADRGVRRAARAGLRR